MEGLNPAHAMLMQNDYGRILNLKEIGREFTKLAATADEFDMPELSKVYLDYAQGCQAETEAERRSFYDGFMFSLKRMPTQGLPPPSEGQLISALFDRLHGAKCIFQAFLGSGVHAKHLSSTAKHAAIAIEVLTPRLGFDNAAIMNDISEAAALNIAQRKQQEASAAFAPTAIEQLRYAEAPPAWVTNAVSTARTADKASKLAEVFMEEDKPWAAETLLRCAVDLARRAHFEAGELANALSRLSRCRALLGRYARSLGPGYNEPSRAVLETAVADARAAIDAADVGRGVQITGLVSRADLNGARGTVLAYVKAKERFAVALAPPHSTRISAKASNLKFDQEPQADVRTARVRLADALLALDPSGGAMEATKILTPLARDGAGDGIIVDGRSIADRLKESRWASRSWLLVSHVDESAWFAKDDKRGIGPRIEAALDRLRMDVVAHLGERTPKRLARFGTDVVAAVAAVCHVVRRGYCDARAPVAVGMVEEELRKIARCLPLRAVAASDDLRSLVFLESPRWDVFGLDRRDRACRARLTGSAADDCDADEDPCREAEDAEDVFVREHLARRSGGASMSAKGVTRAFSVIRGAEPDDASAQRDEAPRCYGCFAVTVLMRLALGVGPASRKLRDAATARLIGLASADRHELGLYAGGRYLEYALGRVAGTGRYGWGDEDAGRREKFGTDFATKPGAVVACAVIVAVSSDHHHLFQRLFREHLHAPEFWFDRAEGDVCGFLRTYALTALDGNSPLSDENGGDIDLDEEALVVSCDAIFAAARLYKGAAGAAAPWAAAVRDLLAASAAGRFLLDRCARKDAATAEARRGVMRSSVARWLHKLTSAEKAGFRWDTFDAATRRRLEARGVTPPTSQADALDGEGGGLSAVATTRACAHCGVVETPAQKLFFCRGCRCVAYCSRDHQKADWQAHKARCKDLRVAREKQRVAHKPMRDGGRGIHGMLSKSLYHQKALQEAYGGLKEGEAEFMACIGDMEQTAEDSVSGLQSDDIITQAGSLEAMARLKSKLTQEWLEDTSS